jgi:DNA-binding phage protein
LITSKIGRYSSKDKEDIAQLLNEADIELLVHLCKMIEKRTDLSQMLKDKFIINCAKFAKEFLDV